jgi:hypothetical protein
MLPCSWAGHQKEQSFLFEIVGQRRRYPGVSVAATKWQDARLTPAFPRSQQGHEDTHASNPSHRWRGIHHTRAETSLYLGKRKSMGMRTSPLLASALLAMSFGLASGQQDGSLDADVPSPPPHVSVLPAAAATIHKDDTLLARHCSATPIPSAPNPQQLSCYHIFASVPAGPDKL